MFHANCDRFLDHLCCQLARTGLCDTALLEKEDLWGLVQRAETEKDLDAVLTKLLQKLTASFRKKWAGTEQARIREIQQYIQNHLADPNLSVTAMAAEFRMSQPAFSAFFKKHTGSSPLDYLSRLRVDRATQLLQETDDTLPEIAEKSGFGSISSLHRVFKNLTGITPAKMRGSKSEDLE